MPIVIPPDQSGLLQSLLSFGAGVGSQTRRNELIEQEREMAAAQQLSSSIGQGVSSVAGAFGQKALRQQGVDEKLFAKFGMDQEQLQQEQQDRGLSTMTELFGELDFERDMASQGFEKGFDQKQRSRMVELQDQMDATISDQVLPPPDQQRQMTDIINDLNGMKPKWIFKGPKPPTAQELWEAAWEDPNGVRWQVESRSGHFDLGALKDPRKQTVDKDALDRPITDKDIKAGRALLADDFNAANAGKLDAQGAEIPVPDFTQEQAAARVEKERAGLELINAGRRFKQFMATNPPIGPIDQGQLAAGGAASAEEAFAVGDPGNLFGGQQPGAEQADAPLSPDQAVAQLQEQGADLLSAALQGDQAAAGQLATLVAQGPPEVAAMIDKALTEQLQKAYGTVKQVPPQVAAALVPLLQAIQQKQLAG